MRGQEAGVRRVRVSVVAHVRVEGGERGLPRDLRKVSLATRDSADEPRPVRGYGAAPAATGPGGSRGGCLLGRRGFGGGSSPSRSTVTGVERWCVTGPNRPSGAPWCPPTAWLSASFDHEVPPGARDPSTARARGRQPRAAKRDRGRPGAAPGFPACTATLLPVPDQPSDPFPSAPKRPATLPGLAPPVKQREPGSSRRRPVSRAQRTSLRAYRLPGLLNRTAVSRGSSDHG